MKNFLLRSAFGIIYVLLVIGSIAVGRPFFGGLMLLFAAFCIIEYTKLAPVKQGIGTRISIATATLLIYISLFLYFSDINREIILIPAIAGLLIALFSAAGSARRTGIKAYLYIIAGVFYIAVPFGLMTGYYHPALTGALKNGQLLYAFFAIIWVNDTFAYLAGRCLGRTKMFPRISPKKTIEGFAGGLVFAMITALILGKLLPQLTTGQWIAFSLITVFFGTFGDFLESWLKRTAGVKDSGTLITGHGGFLDRLDSVLMAAPFSVLYLLLIQQL